MRIGSDIADIEFSVVGGGGGSGGVQSHFHVKPKPRLGYQVELRLGWGLDNYAVDTVSTNKNYAVDTLSPPCTKVHFALKVHFELKLHLR